MRQLAFRAISLAAMLLTTAVNAQTYDLTGTIDGLAGEDYAVTGTATFANNAWTINGKLTPTKPPPQQCQTINAPNGSLTDSSGAVWTWGARTASGNHYQVLRNDTPAICSAGVAISLLNGAIYVRNFSGSWFQVTPRECVQLPRPEGC